MKRRERLTRAGSLVEQRPLGTRQHAAEITVMQPSGYFIDVNDMRGSM